MNDTAKDGYIGKEQLEALGVNPELIDPDIIKSVAIRQNDEEVFSPDGEIRLTDPNPLDWTSLNEYTLEEERKIDLIFRTIIEDFSKRANILSSESHKRLKMYNITRISTTLFMGLALIALVYKGGIAGIGDFMISLTPAIIVCAIIFYVLEAFFKNYEVGVETALAAERMHIEIRKSQVDWALAPHNDVKKTILKNLSDIRFDIRPVLTAEKICRYRQ